MGYVFLCKVIDSDDRDCVAYVDVKDIKNKHVCCDGHINAHGACCSCSFGGKYYDYEYEAVKTILTKDEYESLKNPDADTDWNGILSKLESVENQDLFYEVVEEEHDYLADEYNLSDEDLELIFDTYTLDYMDRAVVGYVFDDVEDFGYEEALNFGYIKRDDYITERYFNYKQFGEDIVNESECYVELTDGRIVSLMY